ncbi:MAG: hypothetical protein LC730_04720 [Acidobacteria bacterium]|nr:hypothetical protein [Acidobacteriota bacterium]MCA1608748.1 hypothetical protein [Acidobacteriota bacterium]
MDNTFLIGLLAWIFPGAGHLAQGRIRRGIIISSAIWLIFLIGIFSGGAYYPGFDFKDGALLYLLNVFAKLGCGLVSVVSFLASLDPNPQAAALATFEYGGRFVETAGLLNYLATIDALDIRIGRKR